METQEEIEIENRIINDFNKDIQNNNDIIMKRTSKIINKLRFKYDLSNLNLICDLNEDWLNNYEFECDIKIILNPIKFINDKLTVLYYTMIKELPYWYDLIDNEMYDTKSYLKRIIDIYNDEHITKLNENIQIINENILIYFENVKSLNNYEKLFKLCFNKIKNKIENYSKYNEIEESNESNNFILKLKTLFNVINSILNENKNNSCLNYDINFKDYLCNDKPHIIKQYTKNTKIFTEIQSIIDNKIPFIKRNVYNPSAKTYNYYKILFKIMNLILDLIETEYDTIYKQCMDVIKQTSKCIIDEIMMTNFDTLMEYFKNKTKEVLKIKSNERLNELLNILENNFNNK